MTLKLMGKKEGMAQVYNDQGVLIPCTVIRFEPNVVAQLKTKEVDGYTAIQLGAYKIKASKVKNVTKPLAGHFKKSGVDPRSKLQETRLENVEEYAVGKELGVDVFNEVAFVDVTAVSKGKGFQGVMKRYNFRGGPASHGSGFHRAHGSTGMRTSPGRGIPGMKMAGHMGNEKVTVQSLKVVKIDAEKQVILVAGSVPGPRGGMVTVQKARKKG